MMRYRLSTAYFAKFKAGGKQFRFSPSSTMLTVAQVRLIEERRRSVRLRRANRPGGRLTFGDVLAIYRAQFQGDSNLKPGTKRRR